MSISIGAFNGIAIPSSQATPNHRGSTQNTNFSEEIAPPRVVMEPILPLDETMKDLTEEQKQQLRDKYDITNILTGTQEYDQLMDDLREMGAISEKDKYTIDHLLYYIGEAEDFKDAQATFSYADDEPRRYSPFVKGDNVYEEFFYGQERYMEFYRKNLLAAADGSTGEPLDWIQGRASQNLERSRACGRIADVLKDIFM